MSEFILGLGIGILFLIASVLLLQANYKRTNKNNSQSLESIEELKRMREEFQKSNAEFVTLATRQLADLNAQQLGGKVGEIEKMLDANSDEFTTQMKSVAEAVEELKNQNSERFGGVGEKMNELATQTTKLNEILGSSQRRGQWGERLAEDILQAAGFIEGVNYTTQSQVGGSGESKGRPDFIFNFPPNRVLFMDVKFPLDAYSAYLSATNEVERENLKAKFLTAVRAKVTELSKRDYVTKADGPVLDYVLLFIPNESISSFVHENDPELVDWSLKQRVVLCSPLNLYAFLGVIRQATDTFKASKAALKILKLLDKFNQQWRLYNEVLKSVQDKFSKAQLEVEGLTSGTRYREMKRAIDKMEALRNEPVVAASFESLEIEESDDDTDDDESQ